MAFSSWSKRFEGKHFEGPRLPFGCRVEYLPRPEEVKALPKFEPRAQVGIVVGYYLQPGAIWKGEFMIVPLEWFRG